MIASAGISGSYGVKGGIVIFISSANRAMTVSIRAKMRREQISSYCVRCKPTITAPYPFFLFLYRREGLTTQSSALIPQSEVPMAMQKSVFFLPLGHPLEQVS